MCQRINTHILKAEKDSADEIPFLIWLYPIKEYTTTKNEGDLSEMYHSDKFIMNAINKGLPLNTVVSTEIFKMLPSSVFLGRIIISPYVHDEKVVNALLHFEKSGGKIIIYGSRDRLSSSKIVGNNVKRIDISDDPSAVRDALASFGYEIRFITQEGFYKLPVITINRSDNAMFFPSTIPTQLPTR